MKHNADTKASDKKDQTPLQIAAYFKNLEVAKLLTEYNADTEARVEVEQTPFHTPTYYGSREVVRMLLADKAITPARNLQHMYNATMQNWENCYSILKQTSSRITRRIKHLFTRLPSISKKQWYSC